MVPARTGQTIDADSGLDALAPRPAPDSNHAARTACWELSGRLTPQAPVQRIAVATQPFTIGRDQDNSLCLPTPTISRRHAELLLIDRDLLVRDLGSRNGTFLNGRRVVQFEKLSSGDMLQVGAALFTVVSLESNSQPASTVDVRTVVDLDIADYALASLQFENLLTSPGLVPHFQPIVSLHDGSLHGHEVLARSRLPGLEMPEDMFRMATDRDLTRELSQALRHEGLCSSRRLVAPGALYLNTHPVELDQPGLFDSLRQLRATYPEASIVLEIHEAAVTSSRRLGELRACLRDLKMRLAYDDFGAGQSRLMELVDVPPDVLKFDRSLVRDLSRASMERQNLVRSLVQIVRELAVLPLAEGVETADEARVCRQIGFELAQGYHFGRPLAAPEGKSS